MAKNSQEYFVQNGDGARGSIAFVLGATGLVGLGVSAAILAFPVHEVGRGNTTFEYGETVSHAVGSVCAHLVGEDGFDLAASIDASKIMRDQALSFRFEDPHSGDTIMAVCKSRRWNFLNNLPW